jgi:hypothetical protein
MIAPCRQEQRSALTALAALATALLLQACGQGASPAPSVRDSAGVTIAEYATWAPDSLPWSVSAQPMVEIGTLEGEDAYQFDRIGGVARLSDGRIVVANGGTQEVRYFDPTGRHLRSTGRKGEGPGEFQSPGTLVVLPGDSVAVYDWYLRRVSFLDPAGAFVRSFAFQHSAGVASPVGRFADGSWLMQPGFVFSPGGPGTTVVRDTSRLLVFGADGAPRDSASRWIGPDFYIRSEGQHASAASLPFGAMTHVAVWGDRYWEGYSDRYQLARRTRSGAADLLIRARRAPVPVTPADVAAHRAARMRGEDAQARPQIERLYQDIPFPATMPAFADLQTDPDGNLWVLEQAPTDDKRRWWTVFDSTGRMLGRVATPSAVAIGEIGRDYILGTWSDAMDVQYVRMFRLDRTGTWGR